MSAIDFSALQLLLKCPSRQALEELFRTVFDWRKALDLLPDEKLTEFCTATTLDLEQAKKICLALRDLIARCLYTQMDQPEIEELFPSDFHGKLRQLLSSLIAAKLPTWRGQCFQERLALPKFRDIQCSIHVKAASSAVARMSAPTALVHLELEKPRTAFQSPDTAPPQQAVDFELGRDTLQAMLEKLGTIRDQLQSMS